MSSDNESQASTVECVQCAECAQCMESDDESLAPTVENPEVAFYGLRAVDELERLHRYEGWAERVQVELMGDWFDPNDGHRWWLPENRVEPPGGWWHPNDGPRGGFEDEYSESEEDSGYEDEEYNP